jgi:hypothetical protein
VVIGHGDIASVIKDRPDVTYFVSGVSNSRETRMSEFNREIELLMDQPRLRHLVYISTLSIYYADNAYVRHKKHMEQIIRNNFKSYTIFRIGNITWGTNPNTLINFLKYHPEAVIQPVYRYLLSEKEFTHWVSMAPIGEKHEMNITGKCVFVPELAEDIRMSNE